MSEETRILLGFFIGCALYFAMEILSGRKEADSAAPGRKTVSIAFFFAGGVSCLFTGRYLLGAIFVSLGLLLRSLSRRRKKNG